jgi:hypothetical protein
MTWNSIINVDEWNKDAIKAFEENKKKVDAGELEITMLIEADGVKQVLNAKGTVNVQVSVDNNISDDTKVLDIYPNNFDYVEICKIPSKVLPGRYEYLFKPRKDDKT